MNKSDLHTGMMVKLKCGQNFIVFSGEDVKQYFNSTNQFILLGNKIQIGSRHYNYDLTAKEQEEELNIVEIYHMSNDLYLDLLNKDNYSVYLENSSKYFTLSCRIYKENPLTETQQTILRGRFAEGYRWLMKDKFNKSCQVFTALPTNESFRTYIMGQNYDVLRLTQTIDIPVGQPFSIRDLLNLGK